MCNKIRLSETCAKVALLIVNAGRGKGDCVKEGGGDPLKGPGSARGINLNLTVCVFLCFM